MNFNYKSVYLINSHKNTQLGFHKNGRSYIIGFPNRDHAAHVKKYVSSLTKCDYRLKEKVDTNINIIDLTVTKRICINDLPSSIKEVPLEEYIMYTLMNNMNIIFAIDVKEEKDSFLIESILIQSAQNVDVFRKNFKIK